jgi:large subunit ribosomal protein L10
MEASGNDYGELPSVLTGNSAIFISELQMTCKIIKTSVKNQAKPLFKGAYIAEIYIGDDQLDALATIKSREELIRKLLDYFNHQHKELFLHFKINLLKKRLLKTEA